MSILVLRKWDLKDVDELVEQANNPNVAKFLTDAFPHPYTKEDAVEFITIAMNQEPVSLLAVVFDNKVIGSASVIPQTDIHCKNAEIGYFLGEDYWGKGIMTEVVRKLVIYGFNTFNINRIFARPFGINRASQRVEKARFQLEACFEKALYKNGVFMDELIYSIRKE